MTMTILNRLNLPANRFLKLSLRTAADGELFFRQQQFNEAICQRTRNKLGFGIFRKKSNNRINIDEITYVEIVSALSRRHRGNTISSANFGRSLNRFRKSFRNKFFVTPIDIKIIEKAGLLAERHFLRGYDAVQLACAFEIENTRKLLGASSIIFVSADNALNQAAQAEGLTVDNPNNYP